MIKGAWWKSASQEVNLKKKCFGRITQVISPHSPQEEKLQLPRSLHDECQEGRARDFASHYSQDRQDLWRADWQISQLTYLLQHSSLPCPGLLLKPPLIYLLSPQQPELQCLSLRTFISDKFLSATKESRRSWEWLAKAGRRKKHREGKSRVCRGAGPADELLQTTPILPRDPQLPSKKSCSLLTFLGHERWSPAAHAQLRPPLTAQEGGGDPKASRNLQHGCRQQVVLHTRGRSSFPAFFWNSLA